MPYYIRAPKLNHEICQMKILPLFSILFAAFSCTQQTKNESISPDPSAHIQDSQIKSILKKAIDKAGGYEVWSNIQTIKYTKHSVLLLEDSTIESDVIQLHEYSMQPTFSARVTWSVGEDQHRIEYDSEGGKKYMNDTLTDSDPSQAVMSALYVLGMPFKLLDAGTNLSFDGSVTIGDKSADVIKATYNPAENDNHSTQDEWYYYFDVNDGDFLGAMVYHAPTYAYIDNLAFDETTPVKFHAHRRSYRSDSLRNLQFLRAEFWYGNYEVN